ncbi:hypothetical protein GCM10009793_10370 [Brachybacterium phenoliresistens]
MQAQRTDDGLLVDREWITRMYGLSERWARKELPVHSYASGGRALHLVTPEVARRLSTTQSRRRRGGAR